MYNPEVNSMVVDIGSTFSKAGYAGENLPRFVHPSYVGYSQTKMEQQKTAKSYIIGDTQLNQKRPDFRIQQIYSKGQILNFQHFEGFLNTILTDDLRYNYYDYSLVLTEDNITNKQQREKICKILFDRFQIKNLFISKKPVLSCYSTGRSTALVLDSGGDSTSTIAVHDGYAIGKTNKTCSYGGQTLNKQIQNYIEKELKIQLLDSKYSFQNRKYTQSSNRYHKNLLLRLIKQSIFKNNESSNDLKYVEYKLPDQRVIKFDKNQIKDPFFNNYNHDLTYKGVHNLLNQTINSAQNQLKKDLYGNIILTGGNSLVSNFSYKLFNKITQAIANMNKVSESNSFLPTYKPKLLSFPSQIERQYSSWIGGSILGSLSSFQSFWISKQQWQQYGISIVQKKCP